MYNETELFYLEHVLVDYRPTTGRYHFYLRSGCRSQLVPETAQLIAEAKKYRSSHLTPRSMRPR